MRRPLLVIGAAFFGAALTASLVGPHLSVGLAVVSALFFLISCIVRPLRRLEAIPAVLLSATAAFCIFIAKEYLEVRPLQPYISQSLTLQAQLYEKLAESDQSVCYRAAVLEGVTSTEGQAVPAGTYLSMWLPKDTPGLEPFAKVSGRFQMRENVWYKAKGVYLTALPEVAVTLSPMAHRPWFAPFALLRQQAFEAIDRHVGADSDLSALYKGICFGDDWYLSDQTVTAFRKTGLSHILSVSGFHMTILTGGFLVLLRLMGLSKRWAAIITMPAVAAMVVLTGMDSAAIRAGLMCILVLAGWLLRREADLLNSLGFAVLVMLMVQPFCIYDIGFLLSVSSMWGLGCLLPVFQRWQWHKPAPETSSRFQRIGYAVRHSIRSSVEVTLAASIPTIPVVALVFGSVPLIAVLSNLLGAAAAAAMLVLGFLGVITAFLPSFLLIVPTAIFWLGNVVGRYLLWVTYRLAAIPFASVDIRHPYLLLWLFATPLAVYAGYRLSAKLGRRPIQTVRMLAGVAVISLLAGMLAHTIGWRGAARITVPAAGDNTIVLLEQDGHSGLVIVHSDGRGLREAGLLLEQKGIRQLDFVWLCSAAGVDQRQLKSLTSQIPAKCLISPDSRQLTTLTAQPIAAGDQMTFWNNGSIACSDSGFVQLSLGQTRLLFCPAAGDTTTLCADWKRSHAVIFDRVPPLHSTVLTTQLATITCGWERVPHVTKALPWGSYPILLAVDKHVEMVTRGQGDITPV